MTQLRQRWLWVAVLVMLSACATLPEYAAPKLVSVEDIDTDRSDSIPYRQLQRSDFKGAEPPGSFDERMAAVTCAYIEPLIDPDALEIKQISMHDGSPSFLVILHNLKFRALMDRNCSWWNPLVDDQEEGYILAHEQIHFALFEVAAREWTEAPPIELYFQADNQTEIADMARESFKRQFEAKMEVLMQKNREFDTQTSVGYDPLKQKNWNDQVKMMLEATAETGRAIAAAALKRKNREANTDE